MLAGPDLLVILAIALIVFGPKKLPELAKTIGKVVGELKKTTEEVKESIGIQELERIRPHLTGVDLLVDLAEKTSEYMTPSDSDKKDTPLSKEEPVREKGLPLAPASKGNGEKGRGEEPGRLKDG